MDGYSSRKWICRDGSGCEKKQMSMK